MSDIRWQNDKIRLGDLKPWERNPRHSTGKQAERIADSHRMFGQVETIAIGPNGEVYNGHQRLSSWLAEYGPEMVVDVRRSSRPLDEAERQALTVMLHAGAVGSWDWDGLSNWDTDLLQGFGFDEETLKSWQQDSFALAELLGAGEMDFIEFEGEGDGGGSQMANGDKVRVVLGPKMFDISDIDHSLYKALDNMSDDEIKNLVAEWLSTL